MTSLDYSNFIAIELEQGEKDSQGLWERLGEAVSVQGVTNLICSNAKKRKDNIKDADIYIHPNLSGFNLSSFETNNFKTMKEIGEETARNQCNELIKVKKLIQQSK